MTKTEVKELINKLQAKDNNALAQISYEELEALKPILAELNAIDQEKLVAIVKQSESEVEALLKDVNREYDIRVYYDEIRILINFNYDKWGHRRILEIRSSGNASLTNRNSDYTCFSINLEGHTRFDSESEYLETVEKMNIINTVIGNAGSFEALKVTLSEISRKHFEKCKAEDVYYSFVDENVINNLIDRKKRRDYETKVRFNLTEGTSFVSKMEKFPGFVKIEKVNDKTVNVDVNCRYFSDYQHNWRKRVEKDEFVSAMAHLLVQDKIEIID